MGNNFYFRNKEKKEEVLHIGKISCGWKPLFHANTYYNSVKQLVEFYNNNLKKLEIIDEYDNIYKFEEFKDIMIDTANELLYERVGLREDFYSEGVFEWTYEEFC